MLIKRIIITFDVDIELLCPGEWIPRAMIDLTTITMYDTRSRILYVIGRIRKHYSIECINTYVCVCVVFLIYIYILNF